jgi:hypothetical protein
MRAGPGPEFFGGDCQEYYAADVFHISISKYPYAGLLLELLKFLYPYSLTLPKDWL